MPSEINPNKIRSFSDKSKQRIYSSRMNKYSENIFLTKYELKVILRKLWAHFPKKKLRSTFL